MPDEVKCPKCGYESGDTWAQCEGSCPMPMSPHYVADEMLSQLQTKYCCAAWNEGCNCGEIADRIIAQAAEIEKLKSIVRGWHYLAVGPDEMGDYYTQKQLIKASEPYASPALAALKDDTND